MSQGGALTSASTTNEFSITPFVVGPSGQAGYPTIQSAIDAAHAAGGGAVWIQQGSYTENLTFYDQIYLMAVCGISQGPNEGVVIIGTHTPPASGHMQINGIYLQSPTAIFSSALAGTTHIQTANCETAVQNGYVYNLPNWSGIIEIYDCNPGPPAAPFAINDGAVNNSGGSPIIVYNSGAGNGTNTMIVSGSCFFGQAVTIGCPLNLITGANVTSVGSQFNGTVALLNNSVLSSYNDSYVTGTTVPITMSSSGNSIIANAVIQTTNTNAIAGAGAGSLNTNGTNFVGTAQIASTVNATPVVSSGVGNPTLSQPKGSLYLRTDGNSGSSRAYINTNGSTSWIPVLTVA